ncbi:hypothetical protein CABS01_16575, partial [Colletotrichum abscissum]|uniref:uncharacterized protein n=1 Tax=Colletotrichum abscissum TaxID=1671311 RepID=UPI0027D68421
SATYCLSRRSGRCTAFTFSLCSFHWALVVRGREDTYGRRSFLDGSFAHENGSQSRFLASAPQSLSCMTDLRRSLLCGVRLAKASSDAPLSLYALCLSIWTAAHADAGFVTVGRRISPAYWYGWFVAAFGSVML